MCGCDCYAGMPQRTRGGIDAVSIADLTSVFLAHCVEWFAIRDAMPPEPSIEPIKMGPATVVIVTFRRSRLRGRFDYEIAMRPGSQSTEDFYQLGFEIDRP